MRGKDCTGNVIADDEPCILQRFVGLPAQKAGHRSRGDHDGLILCRKDPLHRPPIATHDHVAQLLAHEATGARSTGVACVGEDEPIRETGADGGVREQARERRDEQMRQFAQGA